MRYIVKMNEDIILMYNVFKDIVDIYHDIIITFFIHYQLYDTYKSFDNGAIKTSILH